MTGPRRPPRLAHRLGLVVGLVVTLGIAACTGAGAPAPSGPTPSPLPTADPGAGSGGGSSSGNIGSGSGVIVDPSPIDPGEGQPTIVVPRPGMLNRHPVAPMSLRASVDGRHVLVTVSWYSGVEPCNVLDSVRVVRAGSDISIGLVEGASQLAVACIEIAQLKATIVDLGDLAAGRWTIRAIGGDAKPLEIIIT